MKTYKYNINGNDYEVAVEGIENYVATVTVNGESYTVKMPEPEKPAHHPVVVKPAGVPAVIDKPKKYGVKAPLPGVIVDGAHNEDGVEKFVETAEHFQKECPLTLLFSAVDDKDYTDMIHTICSRITFRHVVVTSVGGYRQVPAERFAKLFTEAGASSVEVAENVEKAFTRALEVKGDDGMLFCVGSLYLVGEIKDVIRRNKK